MKEIELKIRVFGDPILRKKAKRVVDINSTCRNVLSAMAQFMYDSNGIGLAAPQVGISQNMIVVDAGSGLYKLVNPKIVQRSGHQELEEGCLSVPKVCIKVKRSKKITVEALDESGVFVKITAEGLFACVLQHEIDHLRGKLIVDYASFFDKIAIKSRLAKLEESARSELSKSKTKSCRLQL